MPLLKSMLTVCCVTALSFVAPADAWLAAAVAQDALPVEDSFVYKQVDQRDLRIDWTRPADWHSSDRRGAVVFFHGGGWTGGAPGQFAEHSEQLAAAGLVCFRVEYRLLSKQDKEPPDRCIEDASDAMRTVRGRAEQLGIGPQRIAAGGGSAGGHLAAYLGTMHDAAATPQGATPQGVNDAEPATPAAEASAPSRRPDAMLLFNPVFDNGPEGWGHQRVGDRYRQYSPIDNISPDDPPAIIFLGTADGLVPVTTGRRFCKAMEQQGVACELHLYEGQPHGFFNADRNGGRWYRETMAKTQAFLRSLGWFENAPSSPFAP